MTNGDLTYQDGVTRCRGYVARPAAGSDGKRPGVLVFHEAWGLSEHAIERADMLAKLGYVALAADLYGERAQAATIDEAQALIGQLLADPAVLRARLDAALNALISLPDVDPSQVGAIGYCLGGLAVLELVRSGAALAAGVTFHGSLKPVSDLAGPSSASLLICTGTDDPVVPDEDITEFRKEMDAAGIDYQIILYSGTRHSFANPYADAARMPGIDYNARSDRRSWNAMAAFFNETFARDGAPGLPENKRHDEQA